MEEQSLRREQGGMRNHLGSIWQPTGKHLSGKHLFGGLEAEEASGRHPGGIWEASGIHLGGIWMHPGGIWDSRQPWGSRRLQVTKIDAPLS